MGRGNLGKGWNCVLCAPFLDGWVDGWVKRLLMRALGLSLFSVCLLLGKFDALAKVIVIGVVATVEIPEWEAFKGQYNIDAKL